MHQEWVGILEVVAGLALSEGETSWHAANNPGTGLNDSALGRGEVTLLLVNWLAELAPLCIVSVVRFCSLNKLVVGGEVAAEEDTHAFSSEDGLWDPFLSCVITIESILTKLFFGIVVECGQQVFVIRIHWP